MDPTERQVIDAIIADWCLEPGGPDIDEAVRGTFRFQANLLSARLRQLVADIRAGIDVDLN